MFNLFVSAYAAAAASGTAGATAPKGGSTILLVVLMVAVFYFLLIRPENKRKKEAENMRNSLKKGDWITTIGGVYGRVVAITDRTVVIETSEDRVRVEFLKNAIGQIGSLDEQAAAQQQRTAFGKKKDKAAAEEETADAAIPTEVPAADAEEQSAKSGEVSAEENKDAE